MSVERWVREDNELQARHDRYEAALKKISDMLSPHPAPSGLVWSILGIVDEALKNTDSVSGDTNDGK